MNRDSTGSQSRLPTPAFRILEINRPRIDVMIQQNLRASEICLSISNAPAYCRNRAGGKPTVKVTLLAAPHVINK